MSAVKWIRKKSRLSKLINEPGGTTIGKALVDAAKGLEPFRAESLAAVGEAIAALESKAAAHELNKDSLDEIYDLSAAINKAAGPFELKDICRAAFSLCDLTDRLKELNTFMIEPVRVHTHALRLLFSNPDLPAEAKEQLLSGLDRVLNRIPASPASD